MTDKPEGVSAPMDERTLTALRGSIEKWRKIVAGKGADHGDENCPLCEAFDSNGNWCKGCPVRERTGVGFCARTPYVGWSESFDGDWPSGGRRVSKRRKNLVHAQAELDFLKSLLPDDAPGGGERVVPVHPDAGEV